jgi:hypothetical protein
LLLVFGSAKEPVLTPPVLERVQQPSPHTILVEDELLDGVEDKLLGAQQLLAPSAGRGRGTWHMRIPLHLYWDIQVLE